MIRDKKLLRIAADFRGGLLSGSSSDGMCFAVCSPLSGLLFMIGVETELEEVFFREGGPLGASNHVFLRLPDGRILDPTADQFGLPPVYLGELPALYVENLAEAL